MAVTIPLVTFAATLSVVAVAYPQPRPTVIVNAASQTVGPVAPGMLITVFGAGLSEETGRALPSENITRIGSISYILSQRTFESRSSTLPPKEWPIRLIYWSPTQINGVADPSMEPNIVLALVVRTTIQNVTSDQDTGVVVLTAAQAPAIFSDTSKDCAIFYVGSPCPSAYAFRRGTVTDVSGNLITSANPATPGEILTVWATGLGGSSATSATELPESSQFPNIWFLDEPIDIGNGIVSNIYNAVPAFQAQTLLAGPWAGNVGVDQINFALTVPDLSNSRLCGTVLTPEMSLEIRPASTSAPNVNSNRIRVPIRILADQFPCSPAAKSTVSQ